MSLIPNGWVRMAAYDTRPDKKHGNPGDEYRVLLAAAARREIDVMTVAGIRGKLVNKTQADAYLAKHAKPSTARQKPCVEVVPDALLLAINSISYQLERIANAMEAKP